MLDYVHVLNFLLLLLIIINVYLMLSTVSIHCICSSVSDQLYFNSLAALSLVDKKMNISGTQVPKDLDKDNSTCTGVVTALITMHTMNNTTSFFTLNTMSVDHISQNDTKFSETALTTLYRQ